MVILFYRKDDIFSTGEQYEDGEFFQKSTIFSKGDLP